VFVLATGGSGLNPVSPVERRLRRGNDALEQSLRTVAETEQVAIGINLELASNRDKIQSSRDKVSARLGLD
jgi:hypothetical protein